MNNRTILNKLSKFFLIFISLVMMGCADAVINGKVDDGSVSNRCRLQISAEREDATGKVTKVIGKTESGANGNAARTILPPTLTEADIAYMKLNGKSAMGDTVNTKIMIGDFKDKSYEVVLSYDLWDLSLKAYNGEDKEILEDYLSADLSNGAPAEGILFHLTAGNISTTGNVLVKGTYTDADGLVKKVSASITDYLTGAEKVTFTDITEINGKFEFSKQGVAPGTYYFMVKALNADDKVIGNWGDLIIVDPDNTSKAENVVLNIEKKPVAPANFVVTVDESSRTKDNYVAKLKWEDKSGNEENFAIEMTEYDAENSAVGTSVVLARDFYGSKYWKSGSLLAGNTECEVRLQTGHLYDFKIKACNTIGDSDYVERSASTSTTGIIGYATENNQHVNIVSIYYDLNGGSLSLSAENTKTGFYQDYKVYSGTDINLVEISTEETGYARGESANHNRLTKWVNSTLSGATAVTKTDKYNNLIVYAYYDETVIISYKIEGYAEMAGSRVKASYATTSTGPFNTDCKNLTIKLGSGEVKYIQFSVTEPNDDDNREYEDVVVILDGTSRIYGNNCIIDTKGLNSQSHRVTVTAKLKDSSQRYSNTFAVTIER